jgi:sugar lactone lactonase YvrE
MASHPELFADGLIFPEGLRWHDDALWFSDAFGASVWRAWAAGDKQLVVEFEGQPSGLGFLPDGTLLVVDMGGGRVLRIDDGRPGVYADLRRFTPHLCNDMLVTPSGRAYVGEFGYDWMGGQEAQPAVLMTIDESGAAAVAADGLDFPNGIVLTADGETLLVAESNGSRVTAFDVAADGELSNRRIWGEHPGFLDGLCLDRDGGLWVATHAACEFVRMEQGGGITDRVEVPGRWALACVLGGPDGTTLYMATCETDGQNFDAAIGRIETADVHHPG